jgi:hypothetical protein
LANRSQQIRFRSTRYCLRGEQEKVHSIVIIPSHVHHGARQGEKIVRETAKLRNCETAQLRNCKTAKLRNCETAKLRNCETVKLRNCETARCERRTSSTASGGLHEKATLPSLSQPLGATVQSSDPPNAPDGHATGTPISLRACKECEALDKQQ